MERKGEIKRATQETNINLKIDIDGSGRAEINTPIPFLSHMLNTFAKHGLFDLKVDAKGDIETDFHHTVEDVGICLGVAFAKALGSMLGIKRFGSAFVPMDEALTLVVVDISNRPCLAYKVDTDVMKSSTFDLELTREFFQAFAINAGLTLHINVFYGTSDHHIMESIFKAFARAMDEATSLDARVKGPPSTKGLI